MASITALAWSTRSGSASDLPIGRPAASMKVLAMPPPTISWSTLLGQRLQDGQLGADLGAGDDGHQRALRAAASALVMASISAASSGPAQATLRVLRDAVGGGFGAVRGAEGVVHEDVAQRGQLARQRLVVLLLALVEAAVLQQHHLAGRDLHAVDPVGHQRHLAAEQLAQALGHRRERIGGLELALGRAAQVRGHHHRRAGVQRHAGCTAPTRGCGCPR